MRKVHAPRFSQLCLFFVMIFLFMPLIVVTAYSFNSGHGMTWQGFSLQWYEELFTSSHDLWRAFWNSILIALTSSLTATVIGSAAAIGLKWWSFRLSGYIKVATYLPMILPDVIIGISMLIFFSSINLPLGMFTIYAAHTTFNLPFTYLLVDSRLDEFDFSTIEAARDLGEDRNGAMLRVVIPSIMPGVLSGFLMAVTMSIEDFVITFFVSGPGSATLPMYVYSSIRYGVSPVINALSFILILASMALAFIFRRFLKSFAASA